MKNETKEKISKTLKGRKHSKEHIENIKKAMREFYSNKDKKEIAKQKKQKYYERVKKALALLDEIEKNNNLEKK